MKVGIDREAIRSLSAEEIIQIRGMIDNEWFSWGVSVKELEWLPGAQDFRFSLVGRIFIAQRQPISNNDLGALYLKHLKLKNTTRGGTND